MTRAEAFSRFRVKVLMKEKLVLPIRKAIRREGRAEAGTPTLCLEKTREPVVQLATDFTQRHEVIRIFGYAPRDNEGLDG